MRTLFAVSELILPVGRIAKQQIGHLGVAERRLPGVEITAPYGGIGSLCAGRNYAHWPVGRTVFLLWRTTPGCPKFFA